MRRRHIRRTTLAVTMLTVATAGVLPGSSGGRSATVEQRSVAVAAQPQTTLAPGESVVVRRHLGALARYLASREWAGPGASAAGRAAASTRDLALGQVFGARASRAHDRVALSGDPRAAARQLLALSGQSVSQFGCLDSLWGQESGWSATATNRVSGAYGIPQALPGSKMASIAPDWRTNPLTQVRWGLRYIEEAYGSPCRALQRFQWSGSY